MGCKKAAAANVESVFSGAGKFSGEARPTPKPLAPYLSHAHLTTHTDDSEMCRRRPLPAPPSCMQRMVKLHYNWKYIFLRPTIEEITKRYKDKFGRPSGEAAPA